MRDAVARVDDGARQRPVCHAIGRPRGREGEYGLYSDIETLDVEGLEEDLGGLFPVLGRIERRFGLLTTIKDRPTGDMITRRVALTKRK